MCVCVRVRVCVCEEYIGEHLIIKLYIITVPFEVTFKFVPLIPYTPQYLHYEHANFWAESSTIVTYV
jgi:hypothetical protein